MNKVLRKLRNRLADYHYSKSDSDDYEVYDAFKAGWDEHNKITKERERVLVGYLKDIAEAYPPGTIAGNNANKALAHIDELSADE